jgi:hypothetical protein
MKIDAEIRHVTKPGGRLPETKFVPEVAKHLQATRKQLNDTRLLKQN